MDTPTNQHAANSGHAQGSTHKHTIEPIERPVGGVHLLKDHELPFQFKQSTFNMYEPFIHEAIKTGQVVEINPSPLRATTVAARLRDAIVAKKRFNWPARFTTFELEQANLVVRHGDANVVIGPKGLRKGPMAGESRAFATIDHKRLAGIFVDKPVDRPILVAFATLLAAKLIPGPVIIKTTVTQADLDHIQSNFDVAAMPVNAAGETIIL